MTLTTNLDFIYYYLGFSIFYVGITILIFNLFDIRKDDNIRKRLLKIKSKYLGGNWSVVWKIQNHKDIEFLYLTKFFANIGVKKLNSLSWARIPNRYGQTNGGFMYKTKEYDIIRKPE